jgi:hypothetical protein
MRGDALKQLSALSLAGVEPEEELVAAALVETIDILLEIGSLGARMTAAVERIASAVDAGGGVSPPSLATHRTE